MKQIQVVPARRTVLLLEKQSDHSTLNEALNLFRTNFQGNENLSILIAIARSKSTKQRPTQSLLSEDCNTTTTGYPHYAPQDTI